MTTASIRRNTREASAADYARIIHTLHHLFTFDATKLEVTLG